MTSAIRLSALTLVFAAIGCGVPAEEQRVLVPEIDGEWWRVAGNPDLGEYHSDEQEPTAFGMWQAADGTWQLWGCIRKTNVGGNTRLFHRWEGASITDANWRPMGVSMIADPQYGETPGGLQSPRATRIADEYLLVYGDWESICLARSADGKTFERQLGGDGNAGMFNEGLGNSTRDPFITHFDGTYYVYYTASPADLGAIYARTSTDLRSWSDSKIVSSGGSAGSAWDDAEVPVVLYLENERAFYLFRTHSEGDSDRYMTSVYRSTDPLDFGVGHDRYLVTTLPAEASWIVRAGDDYFIAATLPDHQGYGVARLAWVRR